MNVLEKLATKLAWKRLEANMPKLKTWAPVIGGLVLIIASILHALGHGEIAAALLGIAATVGLTDQSPVPAGDVTLAVGQLVGGGLLAWGIVRKMLAAAAAAKGAGK